MREHLTAPMRKVAVHKSQRDYQSQRRHYSSRVADEDEAVAVAVA